MKNAVDAVRCLQQLGAETDPRGASAAQIALREGLDPEATQTLLEELARVGLVAQAGEGRYRLARDPREIDVHNVLGKAGTRQGPSLADLLRWELEIFTSDGVARAA